jgi:hypothetical protein
VFYSMDFQGGVDHRRGVSAHLGGAGLVPVGHYGIADEALEFGTFEMTSRLAKGLSAAELPISRHSCTPAIAAGSMDDKFVGIRIHSHCSFQYYWHCSVSSIGCESAALACGVSFDNCADRPNGHPARARVSAKQDRSSD